MRVYNHTCIALFSLKAIFQREVCDKDINVGYISQSAKPVVNSHLPTFYLIFGRRLNDDDIRRSELKSLYRKQTHSVLRLACQNTRELGFLLRLSIAPSTGALCEYIPSTDYTLYSTGLL